MPQDFGEVYTPQTLNDESIDPQSAWVKVFPVFVRSMIDSNKVNYVDTLVYIAGSEEGAEDWCSRNTDIESHDSDNWWWYVITQEAIDGEFSGIRGVVKMLDWDAKPITRQPLKGYKTNNVKEGNS